jgi:hypothetical protein
LRGFEVIDYAPGPLPDLTEIYRQSVSTKPDGGAWTQSASSRRNIDASLTWLGVVFNYQFGRRAATRNWKNRSCPDFKVARLALRPAPPTSLSHFHFLRFD